MKIQEDLQMQTSSKTKRIIALGALALVSAWIPSVSAATPEERAKCEEMFKKMGSTAPHDHGADKTGVPGPMTAEHVRCKEILGEKSGGHTDKPAKHDSK